MYKVLIVDDESIFRRGLRSMIGALGDDWEIVGEAKDGYEAVELLERLNPDVLLTDIRMPRMDGIQLQQLARERFPELFCVVISGYDEFAYVQQSLRMGVKDYLLKPIEREQLADVLDKARAEIENARKHAKAYDNKAKAMRQRHRSSAHIHEAMLKGTMSEEVAEFLKDSGANFSEPGFTCMVIKLDKHSVDKRRYEQADPSLFLLYIRQFANELMNRRMHAYSFVYSDTEVVTLINTPDTAEARRSMLENAESLCREIKALSKLTVTVGIGRTGNGFESIPRSYQDAEIALLHRLIVGGDKVLDYESVASAPPSGEYRKWSWEPLEQAIYSGQVEEAELTAKRLVTSMCEQMTKPETVHQQLCKLVIRCYELAGELAIVDRWLDGKDIRGVLFELCSITSREELAETCGQLLSRLTACVANGVQPLETDPIRKSLRYLEHHYDKPLTLKDVAEHVYLNPAYFSTLFKQRLGKSFVEHLTDIRVEAAKKRLSLTNDKIAVIAEQTGFGNLRHFNRVFKKETGMSPKSYREQNRTPFN